MTFLSFIPAKVIIYQSICSSDLADVLTNRTDRRPKCSHLSNRFKISGFPLNNWSTLRRLCLVFLIDFLKWNLNFCQIYWITNLQSSKMVCFVVDWNTGSENMQIPDFVFLTRWCNVIDFVRFVSREDQDLLQPSFLLYSTSDDI